MRWQFAVVWVRKLPDLPRGTIPLLDHVFATREFGDLPTNHNIIFSVFSTTALASDDTPVVEIVLICMCKLSDHEYIMCYIW